MELYVFLRNEHVATIIGVSNEDCERKFFQNFGSGDYEISYSPNFKKNSDAEIICQ